MDPRDLARAAVLLTRLPIPGADGQRMAAAAWAWPLVAALVALGAGLVALGALGVGLPAHVAAGLALTAGILVTGGLHEDGLADLADGLWGGTAPERRLEILRDSRIGSYGVLALVLSTGLRWGLLAHLFATAPVAVALGAMVTAAAMGRAAMAATMSALPFARADGLARHVGRPSRATAMVAAGLALCCAVITTTSATILAAGVVIGITWLIGRLAMTRLGGQTGDVLGAVALLAEIAALLVMAAGL